jgi:hypothetical protein
LVYFVLLIMSSWLRLYRLYVGFSFKFD